MIRSITALLCMCIMSVPAISKDSFVLDSLGEAQELCEVTHKPLLLIFGADYCKYCHKLQEDISNSKLSPAIDEYIICYIDIQKHNDLKTQYGVSIIPDSRIIKSNKETDSIKGYGTQKYISWLNNARK